MKNFSKRTILSGIFGEGSFIAAGSLVGSNFYIETLTLLKNLFYLSFLITFIALSITVIVLIKPFIQQILNKNTSVDIDTDNKQKNISIAVVVYILTFLLSFHVSVYIYYAEIIKDNTNYAEFVIEGNTFFSEEFFKDFKKEDFTNNPFFENPDKFYPSILVYALENKTSNYQQIFNSALKHGFSIKQDFSFNWYKYSSRNNYAQEHGFSLFDFAVYKHFFNNSPKKINISQFILGYSYADLTDEYLEFLYSLNFDFKEGIALRQEFIDFLNSAFTQDSALYNDLDINLNYADIKETNNNQFIQLLEFEKEQLNKITDFYNKKQL